MQTERNAESSALKTAIVPLHLETRTHVPTDEAAAHLLRKPQTLRIWACKQKGPIQPDNIYGRLGWSVPKLKEILGVG